MEYCGYYVLAHYGLLCRIVIHRINSNVPSTGFEISQMETGYMPGPKPMTFMYEGFARPI
jgi:hypothetical protein